MMQFPRFSSSLSSNEQKVRRLQFGCAILLTLLSIALHGDFMLHGYALWRDEVNSVGLATMPTLRELWASLSYDSSPVLWPLVLRGWIFYGLGDSDFSLRIFGFLMQMLLLAALWFNARALGQSAPVLSLFLVGCQPAIVLWPSLRSYGLGAALILLTFGSLWKALENPTRGRVAAAFLLALLSVQCVYVNLIFLAAICAGGIAVCLHREQKRRVALPCAVFAVAAASLLVYLPTLGRIAQWQIITFMPFGFRNVFAALSSALSTPNPLVLWVWIALATLFIAGTAFRLLAASSLRRNAQTALPHDSGESSAVLLYCWFVALLSFTVMMVFLQRTGRGTYAWHYIGIIILFAVCLDASWTYIVRNIRAQSYLTLLMPIVALSMFSSAHYQVTEKRTNIDFLAAHLNQVASGDDLILIAPCQYAVTFQRYGNSRAEVLVVPDIQDFRIHRYDMLKSLMTTPGSLQRVENRVIKTLISGNKVWLMGRFPPPPRDNPHYVLPEAYGPGGWFSTRYENYCVNRIVYVLRQYDAGRRSVTIPSQQRINGLEIASLEVAQR